MEIDKLITYNYPTVHPFDGINAIGDQLVENKYLAVIDEEKIFYGILTPSDIIKRPHNLVIDCLSKKDSISVDETIIKTLEKLQSNHSKALPVYHNDTFLGIIEEDIILHTLKNKIHELYNSSLISQNLKTSFIHNLSHEVRTPLNHILGFLDIISNLDIENFKLKGGQHFSTVRKSADRFLLIMNDLIDLSLMHSGDDIKIYNDNVRIESVFIELKDYFEVESDYLQKDVTINYANPDGALNIVSDGGKIKHILYHLIDNAIKHSDGICNVLYGYELSSNGQNIVFFVSNTGSQIEETRKQSIFEMFETTKQSKYDFTIGLGIGLTLVKKLVTLMGGTIILDIKNENTITFRFSIPRDGKSMLEK